MINEEIKDLATDIALKFVEKDASDDSIRTLLVNEGESKLEDSTR